MFGSSDTSKPREKNGREIQILHSERISTEKLINEKIHYIAQSMLLGSKKIIYQNFLYYT